MIRVIQLLTEKNHFLEKFYSLNEEQIQKLNEKNYDDIENFYNKREDVINIVKYLDAEVTKAHLQHKALGGQVFTESEKSAIKECLRVKEMFVSRILDQDVQVLALIDQAKSAIIKDLQDVRMAKKAMNGYKANVA